MKPLVFVILFAAPFLSVCQEKNTYKLSVDSITKHIDGLSAANGKSYTKEKKLSNKKIKEEWLHFDDKKLSLIYIEYKIDSTAFIEKYYLQTGALIYAMEQEVSYYPSLGANEYSIWAGDYYFSKGKLIDYVTLGHGKSEDDNWQPEKEVLQRLKQRKTELALLK
ncbi:MAG TPA: hypothetical protein VIZ28_18280 [Chitinophagaceae bacterium]